MKIFSRLLAENRPNLMFRKAKVTGKSVEQLITARVPIPRFKAEPLFGIFPVLEGLEAKRRLLHRLYIKESVRERADDDSRVARILQLAQARELSINRITQAQLDKITEFQLHNGVCLDASPLPFSPPVPCGLSIFLDGVLDPGNIGAIARSALFFGAGQLIYLKRRGPNSITPSMSKASCGAVERLRIVRLEDREEMVTAFSNKFLIGTSDPVAADRYEKEMTPLKELEVPKGKDVVLVLGDEHHGISPELMSRCDLLTTVPSAPGSEKSHVSSLNVSVVAGIILQTISAKAM